jgi:hypothetical protein
MLSCSSAAQRERSRVNAAAKASARSRVAREQATAAACRARCFRLYHVDREMPSASHGRFAGRRGPMPCARRHRSEQKRFFSRRSASVIIGSLFRKVGSVAAVKIDPPSPFCQNKEVPQKSACLLRRNWSGALVSPGERRSGDSTEIVGQASGLPVLGPSCEAKKAV